MSAHSVLARSPSSSCSTVRYLTTKCFLFAPLIVLPSILTRIFLLSDSYVLPCLLVFTAATLPLYTNFLDGRTDFTDSLIAIWIVLEQGWNEHSLRWSMKSISTLVTVLFLCHQNILPKHSNITYSRRRKNSHRQGIGNERQRVMENMSWDKEVNLLERGIDLRNDTTHQ